MVVLKKFKEDFSTAAKTRFGSGWAWLCKKEDGSLEFVQPLIKIIL